MSSEKVSRPRVTHAVRCFHWAHSVVQVGKRLTLVALMLHAEAEIGIGLTLLPTQERRLWYA